MRDQVLVGKLIGIDRLQLAVRLDRGRLDGLVPVAKLLSPELPLDDLFRALEALRDLVLRNGPYLLYAKPFKYAIPSPPISIP